MLRAHQAGDRFPPAENRSSAVRGVHSENQLVPDARLPSSSTIVLKLATGTRPGSAALPSTTSPRACNCAVESPSTSTGPAIATGLSATSGSFRPSCP